MENFFGVWKKYMILLKATHTGLYSRIYEGYFRIQFKAQPRVFFTVSNPLTYTIKLISLLRHSFFQYRHRYCIIISGSQPFIFNTRTNIVSISSSLTSSSILFFHAIFRDTKKWLFCTHKLLIEKLLLYVTFNFRYIFCITSKITTSSDTYIVSIFNFYPLK